MVTLMQLYQKDQQLMIKALATHQCLTAREHETVGSDGYTLQLFHVRPRLVLMEEFESILGVRLTLEPFELSSDALRFASEVRQGGSSIPAACGSGGTRDSSSSRGPSTIWVRGRVATNC